MSTTTIRLELAAARLQAGEAIYIDIRTPEEFTDGHPAGAWNVPLNGSSGGDGFNECFVAGVRAAILASGKPDPELIVGCQVGNRSRQACQLLAAEGFTKVRDFAAGWAGRRHPFGGPGLPGWADSGLPTATEAEPGHDWASLRAGLRA